MVVHVGSQLFFGFADIDRDGTGDVARIEPARSWRARVEHHQRRAGLHQIAQRRRVDAHRAQAPYQQMTLQEFHTGINDYQCCRHHHAARAHALHPRQRLLHLRTKHHARHHRDDGPQQRARRAEHDKTRETHAHGPGQRRCHRGKAGNVFRHQQRRRTPALENSLGLIDAAIGLDGDAAQRAQDAVAVTPPGEIPRQIAEQRRGKRHAEYGRRRQLPAGRERPRDDQHRHRGQRQPKLRQQHIAEHQQQPVLRQQALHFVHGTSPLAGVCRCGYAGYSADTRYTG